MYRKIKKRESEENKVGKERLKLFSATVQRTRETEREKKGHAPKAVWKKRW